MNATHARLFARNVEIFDKGCYEKWDTLDEDSVEFEQAMIEFGVELLEAGWTWQRWFAAERREIRGMERARRRQQAAAGVTPLAYARN